MSPLDRPSRRGALARVVIGPLVSSVVACALTFGAPARADEVSAENKAAARDLATEGIQLAQAGKCDEAIPKLSRAERLFHAPTILTWIGQCQLNLGRYVEGTETLTRVIREDLGSGAPEAYEDAQQKARDLVAEARPKIGKLTIEVSPAEIEGVQVTVDERPVSNALIGAPKPTDPGKHTVTVSAPGYKTATQEVELGEGAQKSIAFSLEEDSNSAAPSPASPAGDDPTYEAKSSPGWIGWATLGVGGALMAGGGVMGYLALSKKNDLECDSDKRCSPSQENTLNAARTNATVSTVLFGVGGAAAVTGVVLLVTGKSGNKASTADRRLTPQVGLGSLGVRGTF